MIIEGLNRLISSLLIQWKHEPRENNTHRSISLDSNETEYHQAIQSFMDMITLLPNPCNACPSTSICCSKVCIASNGKLKSHKITQKVAEHCLLSEQAFRKTSGIQEFYVLVRDEIYTSSTSRIKIIPEDLIQRFMMMLHGVMLPITDLDLYEYRKAISKYTNIPSIKQQVFFLRNNIVVEGCSEGSRIPSDIILHHYPLDISNTCTISKSNVMSMVSISLTDLMKQAYTENKFLVVFAGSST